MTMPGHILSETPPLLLDDTIFEILPAAVYLCDERGVVVRYNRKAAELWGRAPKEGDPGVLYGGALRLFRPDGTPLPRDETPMADALRSGRPYKDVEIQIERPDGRRVWCQICIEPIRDDAGKVIGAINCFQDITARRKDSRRLRENEELLQTVFNTTPGCIKLVAQDGTLLRMNEAGLAMVEAPDAEAVTGGNVLDLIAPEDRDEWRAMHERVCAGERVCWEFDVIGLKGTRRRMESYAAPLTMPDGSVVQLAVTHDVSMRKHDEDAVRDSERRYRALIEALPAPVYTTDAEGYVIMANRAAAELAGRTPEPGVDRWCVTWHLYHPDGTRLPADQCPMAVAIREKKPMHGEEVVAEKPDGTRVPLLVYPTPLFDASGNLAGAVNMMIDISDRLRAERYEHRLAAIVTSSDDAIISKNINGIINSWNAGAERLFGYTAEEVIGKPINILIPDDRPDEEPNILARIRRGERIRHYETVRRRKDGTLIDISLTVSPLRSPTGEIIGASKVARDISERKRHEERRQLLINELNHRVKNTLATVQSIAAQTFRSQEAGDAPRQFEGRLLALSKAHDILTRESWEGADIREVVRQAIAPMASLSEERFEVSGPSRRIGPRVALSLSMALHELCTNAVKYGALSNDTGRVVIEWSVARRDEGNALSLRWEERGGPEVEPPTHKGFGSRLLERALAMESGAQVDLAFPPSGATCTIEVVLS